jgi:uncharacterized protein (DUF2267 family)
MEYAEFIDEIRWESGEPDVGSAQLAAKATLQTLAERLPRSEAQHLFLELPDETKSWLRSDSDAGAFDIDEFLGRVARREGVDVETAFDHARAVFFALGDAVGPEEVGRVAAALPWTFEPLVAEAQHRSVKVMRADEFWSRVATRLGVDAATARPITSAVLETLAQRIAADHVRGVMTQLDPLLHPPLRQGLSSAAPEARQMPLAVFLRRVGRLEGLAVDDAALVVDVFEHAHAVFETLAEAVSDEEWHDVATDLPAEYRGVMPLRPG